jgi:hypothetical protein
VRPDQPRYPHRGAAADEQAALALGQRVEGRRLRDADVRGGGELEAAADDRALQHRDDGEPTAFQALERVVPHHRVLQALEGVPFGELGEIEPGGEVVPVRVQDDRLHSAGCQCGPPGGDPGPAGGPAAQSDVGTGEGGDVHRGPFEERGAGVGVLAASPSPVPGFLRPGWQGIEPKGHR